MLPSLRISPLTGIVAIVLSYTAVITSIIVYIQSIGSGIGIFSELFNNVNIYYISISLSSLVPIKPAKDKPSRRLTKVERLQIKLPENLKEILVGSCSFNLELQLPSLVL